MSEPSPAILAIEAHRECLEAEQKAYIWDGMVLQDSWECLSRWIASLPEDEQILLIERARAVAVIRAHPDLAKQTVEALDFTAPQNGQTPIDSPQP